MSEWNNLSKNLKIFFICMGLAFICGVASNFFFELLYISIGFGIAGWIAFFFK